MKSIIFTVLSMVESLGLIDNFFDPKMLTLLV